MNIPTAGTYNLGAILKKGGNRGFFQMYVNGKAYGSPKDLYNSSLAYYTTDFGAVKFDTAGNHTIEFRVVGMNSSSSSYWMVFDKFVLTMMN